MTLRSEAPSGTPDPYIATLASSARTMARQVLDWDLDRLRLDLGMVEVLPRDDQPLDPYSKPEPRDQSARFLPFFDGTGVLIRDKMPA